MSTCSNSSISSPVEERNLSDFDHLFETPERTVTEKTASPPLFSNIVLKSRHNAKIDLNVLFNILPIVKISPDEIKKTNDDYNEVFISVRKFPKSRGWRGPSNIKSFLDLDFYFLDRNFHIKVSTEKISIVGGGSREISKYLIETLYHHFRTLHDKWISFKTLSIDKRNEISNLFVKNKTPKDPADLDFYNVLDSIIDRNEENVSERLCDIYPLIGKNLYENPPYFTELVNCNSVYNYRLPEEISLGEKSELLHSKGYAVMYHNAVTVKKLKASWTTVDGNKFGFSIQNIGTIKQNSPFSHEENLRMYEQLIRDLGYLPFKEGCKYAIKPKSKSIEMVQKNETCKSILNKYLGE